MIAKEFTMTSGVGVSDKKLPSFDKALLDAGVGNYNLVRLSSILPAGCVEVQVDDIKSHIKEGSLLPTAYSTISSSKAGTRIVSTIGIGFPADKNHVGVIMEFSAVNMGKLEAYDVLGQMIQEAFDARGWELEGVEVIGAEALVEVDGIEHTTFACVCEW